ncbi:MAG TPA: hypothetical protein VN598_11435 [Usitatibacter sp.]|nr:hypothetical protein [Usitatibacter sp.]
MATAPAGAFARRARPSERPMYFPAALVAAFIVFAGFAPTYYLKGIFDVPDLTTLKHLHGAVMTTWFSLFVAQAWLASDGNLRLHRRLGIAGVFLAMVVIAVGMQLGIVSARAGFSPLAAIPALVFLAMPVGEMVAFAGLFAAAIALRKRSDWHKRLMLAASVAMLAPAFARMPIVTDGGPPAFFGLTDLVILGCIAFDTATHRRLHPAFALAFTWIVAIQVGRLLFSQTALWLEFAGWLVA